MDARPITQPDGACLPFGIEDLPSAESGCGDGVLAAGEECDDANLRSHDGCSSGCNVELPVWTQLNPAMAPSPRWGAAATFDTRRARMVLFGGYARVAGVDEAYNDTWEFDGAQWQQVSAATAPSPRAQGELAYDVGRGQSVLFGGMDVDGQGLGDSWTWDGVQWSELVNAVTPPARTDHAMTYDAWRCRVVLFSGLFVDVPTVEPLADTWELSSAGWQNVTSTADPQPRERFVLAYDRTRQVTVLFGGREGNGGGYLRDTWERNDVWTQINWFDLPDSRMDHHLAYHAARRRTMLFGGVGGTYLNDLWEYDGNEWSPINVADSPPPRSGGVFVYDEARHQLVLFGGGVCGVSDCVNNDETWILRWESSWPEEHCTSGSDDDSDGLTDCQDPDCFPDPACQS